MRPQVSLSLDLVGVVGRRESCMVHAVSPLVLMVLFMYVTVGTTEFRYSRDWNFFCTLRLCNLITRMHTHVILYYDKVTNQLLLH